MVKIIPVNAPDFESHISVKDNVTHKNGCTEMEKVAVGLKNLGNTCFLNSTLQCLMHTSPLFNFLNSQTHEKTCMKNTKKFCMLCELKHLVKNCFSNGSPAVNPQGILRNLQLFAGNLRWGRQEDAHEFLRYVIDSMHKSSGVLRSSKKNQEKKSSIAERIFQGDLESQVKCSQCRHVSTKCDPFLDLCIDVKNVPSVEVGLERFTAPETLQGSNAYMCSNCQRKVKATKRFKLRKLPKILTIQLKRYSPFSGGKVTSHVKFPEVLNLAPYMSKQLVKKPMQYDLYAVLIHEGSSRNSGHYYSHVKGPNSQWYCMNDSHVSRIGLQQVLKSQAYLLFYVRKQNQMEKKQIQNSVESKPVILNGACVPNSNGVEERLEKRQISTLLESPKAVKTAKTEVQPPVNNGLKSKNTLTTSTNTNESVPSKTKHSDPILNNNSPINGKECTVKIDSPMKNSSPILNRSVRKVKFLMKWKVTDLKHDEIKRNDKSVKSTSKWRVEELRTDVGRVIEPIRTLDSQTEVPLIKKENGFTCPTFNWDKKNDHVTEHKEDDARLEELSRKKLPFGRPILTWDGQQSALVGSMDEVSKSNRKRKWDLMDEEIDRGKDGKLKKKYSKNIQDSFKVHADKCYAKSLFNGHH